MVRGDKEIWVGVLVLALSTGMVGYLYGADSTGVGRQAIGQEAGYTVVAYFNRSDGLTMGGEVRVAGIPVGQVIVQTLKKNYQVRTTLHIVSSIRIPDDSAAVIQSDSLLGPKFIELVPGGSERIIPPGGMIRYTQDAILIDDLLERILARARGRMGGRESSRLLPPPS